MDKVVTLLILFFTLLNSYSLDASDSQAVQSTDKDEWVIFTCGREGSRDNTEIYRIRPDGSELQQLTDNNLNDRSPIWSPNGEWIAFIAERKEITFLWMDNDAEIYRMRPDGSALQQLTDNNLNDGSPTWSPDGQWIAYVVENQVGDSEIYRMRSDGSDQQRLTQNRTADSPVWSPNGEWIAFIAESGVYRMRPDGENQGLIAEAEKVSELIWSPDGEWLAFIAQSAIYRVRTDGNDLQRLTTMQRMSQLNWSPDGEWLAFSGRNTASGSDLFKIHVEGDKVEQLTDLQGAALSVSWSPNGERIAFSSNYADVGGFFQIYLIKPDGSDMALLTNTPCNTGFVTWFQLTDES